MLHVFFFQAEAGIRDLYVLEFRRVLFRSLQHAPSEWERAIEIGAFCELRPQWDRGVTVCDFTGLRSEERRVGKECRPRWWPRHGDKEIGRAEGGGWARGAAAGMENR